MSDTPRTDDLDHGLAAACTKEAWYKFMLDHARAIERELNAEKLIVERLTAEAADLLNEIEELRAALSGRTVSCERCNAKSEEEP